MIFRHAANPSRMAAGRIRSCRSSHTQPSISTSTIKLTWPRESVSRVAIGAPTRPIANPQTHGVRGKPSPSTNSGTATRHSVTFSTSQIHSAVQGVTVANGVMVNASRGV